MRYEQYCLSLDVADAIEIPDDWIDLNVNQKRETIMQLVQTEGQ